MNEAVIKAILLSVFGIGGVMMVLLGILIWRKLWGDNSVEVAAECIDRNAHTAVIGMGMDRTYYPDAKKPKYRYWYGGKEYISGPVLASNRPGYQPQPGRCTIRIDPNHPERVYSPERKFAALILIAIGVIWLLVAVLMGILLPV